PGLFSPMAKEGPKPPALILDVWGECCSYCCGHGVASKSIAQPIRRGHFEVGFHPGTREVFVRSRTIGGLLTLRGPNDHRDLPISRVRHRADVAMVELVHGHICKMCRLAYHVTIYSLDHGV